MRWFRELFGSKHKEQSATKFLQDRRCLEAIITQLYREQGGDAPISIDFKAMTITEALRDGYLELRLSESNSPSSIDISYEKSVVWEGE